MCLMRVLVYGMVGDHRGGIETFLLKMNQYMSEYTVFDYVIEERSCIHEKEITSHGGNIYYISSRHSHPLKNIRDNKKLLSALKSQIGAVYFNLSSLSWITPIKLAVKMGCRVYVHSHNSRFIKANGSLPYRLVNGLNKKRLHKLDVTRLTCSGPATEFMFTGGDKVEMIYNAINADDFLFDEDIRKKIRGEYNIDKNFVIGFVGRIVDQKNPLFLAEILEKTVEKIPGAKLLIAGEGDLRKELEKKLSRRALSDKVIFLGNITNVNEMMQAMDVFILPSKHEGLPYVVIEAEASGLPCVISDTVTREADAAGTAVFLPITEGPECWADEIAGIFNSAKRDRSRSGQIIAGSAFNIVNEARHLENVLQGGNNE